MHQQLISTSNWKRCHLRDCFRLLEAATQTSSIQLVIPPYSENVALQTVEESDMTLLLMTYIISAIILDQIGFVELQSPMKTNCQIQPLPSHHPSTPMLVYLPWSKLLTTGEAVTTICSSGSKMSSAVTLHMLSHTAKLSSCHYTVDGII